MLVNLKEVMECGIKGGYAVGAFNITNLETLIAVTDAARETGKGVILQYAEVHQPYITLDAIGPIMVEFAKKASVPICVHLDHGSCIESCMQAMRLGFTSVMIDASSSDYEKNVATTREVVRWAHSVKVTVEAELGHIFSSDGKTSQSEESGMRKSDFINLEDAYTDPEVAKEFVKTTGVDALAIAFGTTHGIYTKKPVLDLDRIRAIRECVDIPLVMHGGSGLSKEEFQTAIRNGIRKINYYTYVALAGAKAVKKVLDRANPQDNIFFHDIPLIGIQAMKEDIERAIRIFSLEV